MGKFALESLEGEIGNNIFERIRSCRRRGDLLVDVLVGVVVREWFEKWKFFWWALEVFL